MTASVDWQGLAASSACLCPSLLPGRSGLSQPQERQNWSPEERGQPLRKGMQAQECLQAAVLQPLQPPEPREHPWLVSSAGRTRHRGCDQWLGAAPAASPVVLCSACTRCGQGSPWGSVWAASHRAGKQSARRRVCWQESRSP